MDDGRQFDIIGIASWVGLKKALRSIQGADNFLSVKFDKTDSLIEYINAKMVFIFHDGFSSIANEASDQLPVYQNAKLPLT